MQVINSKQQQLACVHLCIHRVSVKVSLSLQHISGAKKSLESCINVEEIKFAVSSHARTSTSLQHV